MGVNEQKEEGRNIGNMDKKKTKTKTNKQKNPDSRKINKSKEKAYTFMRFSRCHT